MNKNIGKEVRRIVFIIIGSMIMAFNIKTFVSAGGLFPGGFTGISVLIQRAMAKYGNIIVPYAPISLLLNAFPAAISWKYIGKKFTLLSCLAIVITSLFTDILPSFPITYDPLLISIFGGMLMGAGIGFCLQADATSGGTDFIAMFFSQKYGIDTFDYVLGGNVILLIIAGVLFGWDAALYSIIFQFSSTEIVHICNKRYKRNTLIIITSYPDETVEIIDHIAHHGATKIEANGTYSNKERFIIYSVVGSEEVKKIIAKVKKVDEHAFINVLKTDHVEGRFYMPPID